MVYDAMLEAEELSMTPANVDQMRVKSTNTAVRLLAKSGEFGELPLRCSMPSALIVRATVFE